MTHGYLDAAQLALLVLVVARAYCADVRQVARRFKRRRARRSKVHTVPAHNGSKDDAINVAAQIIADETKRRLWLISSGSNDVA